MFVDRQQELTFLNGLLTRKRPGPAQMVLMYGRRRVGKSELLLHWAEQSGLDYVYWEAVKENANQQRAHFYGKLLMCQPPLLLCIDPGLTSGRQRLRNFARSGRF
jgi:uncharacterized protein